MLRLILVPPAWFPAVEAACATDLLSVCRRSQGLWTPASIARRIETGEWQLWLAMDGPDIRGVFGSRLFLQDDGRKAAEILFGTGRGRRRWQHLIEDFEHWARRNGCARITSVARLGWSRILPGYRATHALMEKDLF